MMQKVAAALLRFAGPEEEPAPPLTSWDEFLKPPTAEERAAAEAADREAAAGERARRAAARAAAPGPRAAPRPRTAPRPRPAPAPQTARQGSRRRRRRHAQATPRSARRTASESTEPEAKPDNRGFLSRTYDVTASASSGMKIINTSAPVADEEAARSIRRSRHEEPPALKPDTPRSTTRSSHPSQDGAVKPTPPSASIGGSTAAGELVAIRELLENLVASQLRIEARLAASAETSVPAASSTTAPAPETATTLATTAPAPATTTTPAPVPAPESAITLDTTTLVTATATTPAPTVTATPASAPATASESKTAELSKPSIQDLLLVLTRQIDKVTDRVNEIERRSRVGSTNKPRRHRRSRTRRRTTPPMHVGEPRGPPGMPLEEVQE